jgi:putative pyruvate formate lyase activating enzyme
MNKALSNYYKILAGKSKPRFKSSDLNKKIIDAFKILKKCELCSRKCMVNRTEGGLGFCKVGNRVMISSCFDHYGEEDFFVPSFTIFFWSCTFSCQFCQNWTISQRAEVPRIIKETALANIIDSRSHCKNVNFVGGEPTPYLPFILKILKHIKSDIAVVWNSNFYMSEKSMDLLKDVVDVYLSDFKYGNDKCALRLSKVPNYSEIVKRNHALAFKDSELVIRHLILPSHFDCCTKPVLDFIGESFGDKVVVNIMDQYHPGYKADEYKDINRGLTSKEFDDVVKYAERIGLNFIA